MTTPEVAPPDGDDPYRLNNFTAPDLQRILNREHLDPGMRAAAEAALAKLAGGQRIKSQAEIDLEVKSYAAEMATDTPTPTAAAAEPPAYRYITLDELVAERVATREQLATNYRNVRRRHLTQLAATTLAYALLAALAALFAWHATTDTNPWAILDWTCVTIPAVGVLGGISLIRQHTHPRP